MQSGIFIQIDITVEEQIAILILAAGESKRFGQLKQLLKINGDSLLQHTVKTAIGAYIGPVVVVTGYENEEIGKDLDGFTGKIQLVHNHEWQEGIGSSIRTGIHYIRENLTQVYGVIIMLCDQPLIKSEYLINMVRSHFSSGKKIIASGYGGSWGVPVFFQKKLFGYLAELKGDKGAKSVVNRLKQDVHVLPNPDAELDIDIVEDYDRLKEILK